MVRRTEIYYYTPDQGLSVAPDDADMMGDLLGWDGDERKRQVENYKKTVDLSRQYAR
jgi:glycerol-3-phosphate dehydrogenase